MQPPLDIGREQVDYVIESLDETLTRLGRFPHAAVASVWQAAHADREEEFEVGGGVPALPADEAALPAYSAGAGE
jgi:hypothetical protein